MSNTSEMVWSIPGFRIRYVGEPQECVLVSVSAALDWVTEEYSRAESTWEAMIHPTAIEYRGRIWRVHSIEESTGELTYRLIPWPVGEVTRRIVVLAPGRVDEDARREQKLRQQVAIGQASLLYDWALGFLPARWQEGLMDSIEFDPVSATRHSGVLEFLAGIGVTSLIVVMLLATKDPLLLPIGLVFFFMTFEGVARWQSGLGDKACGLYILEALDLLIAAAKKQRR